MKQTNRKDEFYKDKITVWAFFGIKDCPLKLNEILVYSLLASNDRNRKPIPNDLRIAWSTGIDRHTVAGIMDKLKELGFIINNQVQDKSEYFQPANSSGSHWSQKLQRWVYLVPTDGKLTVADAAVYSLFAHCFLSKYNFRWAKSAIATRLKMHVGTVNKSLKHLTEYDLITDCWQNGDKPAVAVNHVGVQLELFKKKYTNSKNEAFQEFQPNPRIAPGELTPSAIERNVLKCVDQVEEIIPSAEDEKDTYINTLTYSYMEN